MCALWLQDVVAVQVGWSRGGSEILALRDLRCMDICTVDAFTVNVDLRADTTFYL